MAAPPAALMTAKVAMDRIEMQTQTRGKENRSVSPPKHFTFIYNTLPICYQIIIMKPNRDSRPRTVQVQGTFPRKSAPSQKNQVEW